jgi:hypothetical protein
VTSIGFCAFANCYGLTSITIPDNVTSIEDKTFYRCTGLTSVTIGNGVKSIGKDAFLYCNSLTSVTIPNSVTTIGDQAFLGCPNVTSITIGSSVTNIGFSAFMDWVALRDVYCYAEQVPEARGGVFSSGYNMAIVTLHVPAVSLEAYRNTVPWQLFGTIVPLEPTGIDSPTITKLPSVVERYDMSGRSINQPQSGLNIVKMSDGTTRKVMIE